jgi:hypothetical protein
MIDKERFDGVSRQLSRGKERAKELGSFWPQWTEALLATLSEEANLIRTNELKIAGMYAQKFLGTRPCVEHHRQQDVVSLPTKSAAVDGREHRLDFLIFEVLHGLDASAFEGYAEDSLAVFEIPGVLGGEKAKEGMDGGEAHIAGGRGIVAFSLEVIEEGDNFVRSDVGDIQHIDGTILVGSEETKEQGEAISVAADRMGTHAAQHREMIAEELAQGASQGVGSL